MLKTRLLLTGLVLVTAFSGLSRAELDPERNKPYRLQVVLHVAEHRQFTSTFKELLESELRDSLQAALGKFASVEVVTKHPKLDEVVDRGLSVLDGWKDVTDVKTHFVLVDFVGGQYELQSRQHDGLTGQASPVVRRERTNARDGVARSICLLIGRDFGLVGTVTGKGEGDTVQVTLKASGLGVSLEPWVRKDEVFALVQMTQAGGVKANRVDGAVLQVVEEPKDGVCVCKVWARYVDPLELGAGILGYRCVKLPTISAAVRIRLMKRNATTPTPEDAKTIQVRKRNFVENVAAEGSTNHEGLYSSEGKKDGVFDHIAFISVLEPGKPTPRAQIPVPLIDERTVVIDVNLDAADNLQFAIRRNQWVNQAFESRLVLENQFKQLETLVNKDKKLEEAIERARALMEGVDQDISRLADKRAKLEEEAKKSPGVKLDLNDGDLRLNDLRAGQEELKKFIASLEDTLKTAKDPMRLELQSKASLGPKLEAEGEYHKALELYQEVIDGKAADQKLIDHYNRLKDEWQEKGDKHAEARKFIYETWATIDPLKVKEHLDAANASLDECKKAGDKLAPRRLKFLALAHGDQLRKKLNALDPEGKEEDREPAKLIVECSDGLIKLVEDINAYLK